VGGYGVLLDGSAWPRKEQFSIRACYKTQIGTRRQRGPAGGTVVLSRSL